MICTLYITFATVLPPHVLPWSHIPLLPNLLPLLRLCLLCHAASTATLDIMPSWSPFKNSARDLNPQPFLRVPYLLLCYPLQLRSMLRLTYTISDIGLHWPLYRLPSDDTTIVTVQLYEVQNKKDMDGIIPLVKNVDNSTCIIIFASTHSITTKYLKLVHNIKTLIWLVVVDELHLFDSFGRSFREKLPLLQ